MYLGSSRSRAGSRHNQNQEFKPCQQHSLFLFFGSDFIQSINIYYVPGAVVSAGDAIMNEIHINLCLLGTYFPLCQLCSLAGSLKMAAITASSSSKLIDYLRQHKVKGIFSSRTHIYFTKEQFYLALICYAPMTNESIQRNE